MSIASTHFNALYRQAADADPWGYRTRWYERRKRALTLAALHRPRYMKALELGCSTGELTVALAKRCDSLVATDASCEAIAQARKRACHSSTVSIEHMRHPAAWPQGRFDLVVFSELGYYLDLSELEQMVGRIRCSLTGDALVLACHWRHPIPESPWSGDAVHDYLNRELAMPRIFRHIEEDLLLEGWTSTGRSVAAKEGLV